SGVVIYGYPVQIHACSDIINATAPTSRVVAESHIGQRCRSTIYIDAASALLGEVLSECNFTQSKAAAATFDASTVEPRIVIRQGALCHSQCASISNACSTIKVIRQRRIRQERNLIQVQITLIENTAPVAIYIAVYNDYSLDRYYTGNDMEHPIITEGIN